MTDMTFELVERSGDAQVNLMQTRDSSSSLLEVLEKSYLYANVDIVGWGDQDSTSIDISFSLKIFPTFQSLMARIYKNTMFELPQYETDENRARHYFKVPYTPTPKPEPEARARHDKLRIRKTLYAYQLLILRQPGEKLPFGPSEKIVETIDAKQRTVWQIDLADQFEAWALFREVAGSGTLINPNRPWELYCKGKRLNFQMGSGRHSAAQLDKLVNAWLTMYPDMPMQQAIHRVFHERHAGWLPERIDYRNRAELMHQKYQKLRNEFDQHRIRETFTRRHNGPAGIPPPVYLSALRVILEQFIRGCAAAHQHTNVSKLYAVGPRYQLGTVDATGFLNGLQYFGTDAATAVEYLRTWYSQHYYGGGYERNFCLYELDITREPAVLVEVHIQDHEKIAQYARLAPRPASQ